MKLKMHSFDFGESLLTFRVPPEIFEDNRWGNVPEGVEVDLSKVTGNAALGIAEPKTASTNNLQAKIASAIENIYSNHEPNRLYSREEVIVALKQLRPM